MTIQKVDILIIGGGLIGATFMIALKNLGYSSLLVESKALTHDIKPDFDARSIALSPASKRILNTLGVWSKLEPFATPINTIHVSEQGGFGAVRLPKQQDPLGYVIEMQHLQAVLYPYLTQGNVLAPASLKTFDKGNGLATIQTAQGLISVQASLIVAADGADSLVRKWCELPVKIKDYHQQAIIANVALARPHQFQAFERFTAEGPLALLPLSEQRSALIWTVKTKNSNDYLTMPDKVFLDALQKVFGYRLGRLMHVGERFSFPLKQSIMPKQIAWPAVFVGNAAHTLHPVAGQGFNLGLRDVATLAQCIQEQGLTPDMLTTYEERRQMDQVAVSEFTDSLVGLFTSTIPGVGIARKAGLILFDNLPILKRTLAYYARGFGGYVSDLVCEVPLIKQGKNHDKR